MERRIEPVVRVAHDAERHAALVQRLRHVVVQVALVQMGQVGEGRGVLAPVGNVELGLPARRGQSAYEELKDLLAGGLGDVDKGEAVFEGKEHDEELLDTVDENKLEQWMSSLLVWSCYVLCAAAMEPFKWSAGRQFV